MARSSGSGGRGSGTRVQAIDGLRGVAALLVVLYHLHEAIARTASDWLPAPLEFIARYGYMGVDIFFVISGFVIALSVSRGQPTFSYLGRFIFRRSIRLDPPYWVAILLEIGLLLLTLKLFTGITATLPSTPQLLSHLFYAQELLGYGSIVQVFWTLCYEIQFYLFLVGSVVLYAKLPTALRRPALAALAAAAVFLLSLYVRYFHVSWLPHGLALDRWFQFFIGVLTWRVVTGRGRFGILAGAWALLVAAVLLTGAGVLQFLVIAVSGLLVAVARRPAIGWILTTRPVQFLGLISYSLYLYHASVGWRFVSLVQRLNPGEWSSAFALLVYLAGTALSIGVAAALWWLIERPFLALSQRIRLPLRNESTAGTAPVAA
ncbi:MAG TPA: acyltransferase, partial [Gemmatimonadales bacterium]|nr:acyltransferase [Gemmatimonadales bacterium]